jgi:hypothetical protein
LLPALQVNNRKTAHRQAHAVIEVKPIVIRPAMMNRFVHARQQLAIDRRAITANNSCYATHLNSFTEADTDRAADDRAVQALLRA